MGIIYIAASLYVTPINLAKIVEHGELLSPFPVSGSNIRVYPVKSESWVIIKGNIPLKKTTRL